MTSRLLADSPETTPSAQTDSGSGRFSSIDILRGLVMIVMALDHTREYFHIAAATLDPTDPARSHLVLYGTRWVTCFCAPTFVLLSGLSAYLRGSRSTDRRALSWFLASRGLWLIFLELTVVALGFTFHPGYLFLQVIWVIGAGFLVLALLCWLPSILVLLTGVLIVVGHNLLDDVHSFQPGGKAQLIDFVDGRFSFVDLGPLHGVLLYSALGWVGILLIGYGLGPLYALAARSRRRVLVIAGVTMVAAFFVLRLVNLYGDPSPWAVQGTVAQTAMSFLRVSKYPPSLDFALATLGPMLILLAALEQTQGRWAQLVRTYGRVPLFYYVLHIYLIHASAVVAGAVQGIPFAKFTDPLNPPTGFGVSLGGVYLIWVAIVAALYLPCRWFERFRARRSDWWLSYL